MIRKYSTVTGIVTRVTGIGSAGYGGDGRNALLATISSPFDVFVSTVGHLYLSDAANNRIRFINQTSNVITTIIGNGAGAFNGDGKVGTATALLRPFSLWVDTDANVYFVDYFNVRVRKLVQKSGIVQTVAGTGTATYNGDGIAATSATVNFPGGKQI